MMSLVATDEILVCIYRLLIPTLYYLCPKLHTVMVEKDKSLLHYNTFGLKVNAAYFAAYESVEELKELLSSDWAKDNSLLLLGGGSNILFLDDFEGLVLFSKIKGIKVVSKDEDNVWVEVGAGEKWDDFVAHAVRNGWYGAENLSGIPGQVGASAIQNIGAYGSEAKDLISSVSCVEIATGQECVFEVEDLDYGYRHSRFKTEWKDQYVVTSVTYRLSLRERYRLDYGGLRAMLDAEGEPTLQKVRDAVIRIRNAKLPDPKVFGNAGSFFMNPVVNRDVYERLVAKYGEFPHFKLEHDKVKIPAAWLIEQSGWKGKNLAHAAVHDVQPLVLINLGGATGKEILELSQKVAGDVWDKFSIRLHREVIVV